MKKLDFTKIIIVFAMLLGFVYQTNAQSAARRWSVGAYASLLEYKGTLGSEWWSFDFDEEKVGGGFSVAKYVSPSFNVEGRLTFGQIDHQGEEGGDYEGAHFHAFTMLGDLNCVYKFTNGYILPEDFIVSPFIMGGLGGNYIAVSGQTSQWGTHGQNKRVITPLDSYVGLGAKFFPAGRVSLYLQTGVHFPWSDRVDGQEKGEANVDAIWEHNIGATYNFLVAADEDGDGVPDHRDYCPETPEGVDVDLHGCAKDSDGDGIADFEDECPEEPGLIRFNGCPDMDGDGIPDKDDECIDVPGIKKWKGCPDTDGDAIIDRDDECPDVAGPLEMNGCPCDYKPVEFCGDQDGDGISDMKDKCADTPKDAKVDENGCPVDTDGDGVPDYMDKCPDVAGKTAYEGCPEAQAPMINLNNINFETASNKLTPKSLPELDKIADVMAKNPNYVLDIQGHTDSRGTEEYNNGLSDRRAKAAKEYLVKKGIVESRMTAKGYGEGNPMATNATAEGMALNRRVEFKLSVP